MLWYPYTQMKTMSAPFEIVGAKGVKLYTKDKELIDSISSWWSVIHGYNHPEINAVLKLQVDMFSHVMLGSIIHQPAEKLSAKLAEILPEDLDYTFFSDSGSVAVEVALKMSIQYYFNKGCKEKSKILALEHAYHGDTFKTMEVGDDEDYHLAFPNKSSVIHIPTKIDALEEAFSKHHHELAAFIVEPLLQGAGGMLMYELDFLKRAKELCKAYNVLLVFDEVATGFGRTGHAFVSDIVCPDIIVLGKALTAGYMGHAVTVANKKVFDGFYSDNPKMAFMHGPTFMANPLACTVALKSIEIFYRDNYLEKIKFIERYTKAFFKDFSSPEIKEIRIMGACVCIEVYEQKVLEGFQRFAYSKGVFNRPFLKFMYAMVPYIISQDELHKVLSVFKMWFERE